MPVATELRRPIRRQDANAALEAFFNIAEKWKMTTDEQIILLGSPARSTFFKWKKEGGMPPHDTLERISYIAGIYSALHILFSDDAAADGWVRKANNAPLFGGLSALEFMTRGSIVDLYDVRRYVDVERGGWS